MEPKRGPLKRAINIESIGEDFNIRNAPEVLLVYAAFRPPAQRRNI